MLRRLPEWIAAMRTVDRRRLRRAAMSAAVMMAAAGVIAGLVHGYRVVTSSESFAIHAIEVHGNHAVSDQRVAELLGVVRGDNIFRTKLDAMAGILENEPWIARAQVRRGLPDTLVVDVEEHTAAALIELDGLYLADERGHVFKRASIAGGEGDGIPIITGLGRDAYIRDPAAAGERIREALAAAAMYEESGRPPLGEIHVHPRHGITVLTYDGAVAIRLGHGERAAFERRLRGFDVVWRELSPEERRRARIVFAGDSGRVTVAFDDIE